MICEICGRRILPGERKKLPAQAGTPGVSNWPYQHQKCWSEQLQKSREEWQQMTKDELTASLLRDFGMES